MIAFQYQAKSRTGELQVGLLEAETLAAARQDLRGRGLFPMSVTKAGSERRIKTAGSNKRVSKRDLMLMTTQLSIMQKSGVDLAESIKNVSRQVSNKRLATALNQIVIDIEDGKSFSAALQAQSSIFGDAYVAGIAAGEASGTLGQVLARLTTLLRNEVRLINTIKSIATYPVILMCVAGMVVNALMFFVLPQFAKVFRDLDKTPPITTQILLSIGEFVRGNFLFIGIGFGVIIFGFSVLIKTDWFRKHLDHFMLYAPGFGKATRTLLAGRMFRLIGTMLQSGVPLLEAVRLCSRSIKNRQYQKLFSSIEQEVTRGNGISIAMMQANFLPDGAVEMISTSEKSGDLGGVMEIVGEFYEDEGENYVRDLAKVIEPAIIVVMGGVVAVVVISVILPLLDMSSTSGY